MSILNQTLMTETPDYLFFAHQGVDEATGAYTSPVLVQVDVNGVIVPVALSPSDVSADSIVVRRVADVPNAISPVLNRSDPVALDTFTQSKLVTLLKMLLMYQYGEVTAEDIDAYLNTELENMKNESMIGNVNEMLSQNKHKYDFQEKKNRLITLMAKNNNIRDKHTLTTYYLHALLFGIVLYVFFTGALYMYGLRAQTTNPTQLEPVYYTLIAVGLVVMLVVVMVDVYRKFKMKHYEHFVDVSDASLVTKTNKYITDLPNYANLYVFLEKNLVKEHGNRKRMAESMLNEFDVMNYKSMRTFQLTNYQINRIRHNIKYITHAFLAVAAISVMGGLNLRTNKLLAQRTVVNGLPVTTSAFVWITVLLVAFLLLVMALQEHQNKSRRRYNWNKMYWLIKNSDDDDAVQN